MRFRFVLVTFFFLACSLAPSAFAARFDDFFADKTMRVDYFHTGNHGEEVIALDSIVSDGPWPGSRTRLLDASNLGEYFFDVVDRESNQVVYSRGFNSVFGEWATTDEAKVSGRHIRGVGALPVAEEAGAARHQAPRQGTGRSSRSGRR